MKKLSKNYLRKLIVEELSLLAEGEEDDIFGGSEEEDAADEGGDTEEAAEDTEEEGDEAEGEEEATDEEGGEEGGGEEEGGEESEDAEESEAPEDEATGPSDSGVDVELNNILADFEAQALAITQAEEPEYEVVTQESFTPSLSRLLFEEEEAEGPTLDIPTYSNNVARLIQNYQSLMDMEKMIFTKARDFLTTKYGEEMAVQFEEDLEKNHGITFDPAGLEQDAPVYAVGAMTAQA